uniref:Uncharacterized protein n=1 Tax=Arundo donax TaxID=35708 RepID=A0A0A9EXQ0_ARUDO
MLPGGTGTGLGIRDDVYF